MTTSDENVPDAVEESAVVAPDAMAAEVVPDAVAEPVAAAPAAPAPMAPPSAQPMAYAPPAAYAPSATPNTWMNIVAFVTAIMGLAVVPIVFGHLGINAANKGKAELKWMGIVGAILGYLELVFWITIWALIIGGTISNVNDY